MFSEFETKRPPFDDKDKPVAAKLVDYDASLHHPVFFGPMHAKVVVDADLLMDFDVSLAHPASVGYAFVPKPPPSPLPTPPTPPGKNTCKWFNIAVCDDPAEFISQMLVLWDNISKCE